MVSDFKTDVNKRNTHDTQEGEPTYSAAIVYDGIRSPLKVSFDADFYQRSADDH